MVNDESGINIVYYPGCTLHTWARSLSDTFLASFKKLKVNLNELSDWACCQAVFPLALDNIMGLVPAARILIQAKEHGDVLTTLCSFCFNVLRRTNMVIQTDEFTRAKINAYLEEDYSGELKVLHPLEILRDYVGFGNLTNSIEKPLKNLKIAPYYGCQLIRPPKEMKFDDPEDPKLLNQFLKSIGCEVVDFPFKVECCGSYQIVKDVNMVLERTYLILSNALRNGAEAIALSCPLCFYNLDKRQNLVAEKYPYLSPVPVFYFTELLGIALGIDKGLYCFESHKVDPSFLLESVGSSGVQEQATLSNSEKKKVSD